MRVYVKRTEHTSISYSRCTVPLWIVEGISVSNTRERPMEPYILMRPSVATPLIQLYGRVGRRSLQYSRDSKAVSEGHLSAVDPPPRVLRVPKPKLLMYPWMYFPGEEPMDSSELTV